METLIKEALE